jgi:hypothetical protein
LNLSSLLAVVPWPLSRWQVEWSRIRLSPSLRVNRALGRSAARTADLAAPAAWGLHGRLVEDFVRTNRSLYDLVLDMHGTSIFVDGQKSWRRAALLGRELPSSDEARIIHLVRDPRGFALSQRQRGQASHLLESAWLWRDLHTRMRSLNTVAPYHLLRYEDLAVRPEGEMRKVFEFLGVEPQSVVDAPRYPAKHHVVGNEMARSFAGDVKLDTRWRTELSAREQQAVLAAAGPFAAELGYAEAARAEDGVDVRRRRNYGPPV